jgi:GNAT superfamily N-acetyltransferase
MTLDAEEQHRLADGNVVAAFSVVQRALDEPGGGARRFGSVIAIASGPDLAFFNRVFSLEAGARTRDLLAAVDWIDRRGWPLTVQLSDRTGDEFRAALTGLGLSAAAWASPIMVLDPIGGAAPRAQEGLGLRTGGLELRRDFVAIGPMDPAFERALGPRFAADHDVRLAVGYRGDLPVARAAAVRSDSTVGIYAVGTARDHRRRGYGRAVSWAAIEAGVDAWAGTLAVLQSSEMGVPVYASIGFAVVGRYLEFVRPGA